TCRFERQRVEVYELGCAREHVELVECQLGALEHQPTRDLPALTTAPATQIVPPAPGRETIVVGPGFELLVGEVDGPQQPFFFGPCVQAADDGAPCPRA